MSRAFPQIEPTPVIEPPHLLVATEHENDMRQELLFVGVKHFNSPRDTQYMALKGLWDRFVRHHRTQSPESPIVLLSEGGKYRVIEGESPEAALRRGSEQAMLANLADRDGVESVDTEPSVAAQLYILHNRHHFPPDMLAYFYYMRRARQYLSAAAVGMDVGPYDAYARSGVDMPALEEAGVLDFSRDSLEKTHQGLFPDVPFDPLEPLPNGSMRDPDFYTRLFSEQQHKESTDLQMINHVYQIIRNTHLRQVMRDEYWDMGYYVFTARGLPHLHDINRERLSSTLGSRVEAYLGLAACRAFLRSDSED
jgi:hypothetical protein